MPLEQRVIEPLSIFRDNLPQINNQTFTYGRKDFSILECVANGSLANVIRQLSCLAFYADDIFNGILTESKRLSKKTEKLQNRINKLSTNVSNLDFQQEEVPFIDLNYNELFKSSNTYDQEVLSRQTMPSSLIKKYSMCDKPPPLDKLNYLRDDGKDSMKFYTDPKFFFDLWKNEMLKKTEKEKFSKKMISNQSLNTTKQIEESHNKQVKKPRKPESTTEKYRRMMSQQEFFADSNDLLNESNQSNNYSINNYSPYDTIEVPTYDNRKQSTNQVDEHNSFTNNNLTVQTKPQLKQLSEQAKENTNHVRFNQTPEIIPNSPIMRNEQIASNLSNTNNQRSIPPPPPMPSTLIANNPSITNNSIKPKPLNSNTTNINNNLNMNKPINLPQQTTSLAQEIIKKQQELRSANINTNKPVPQDPRTNLLASIREGIKLRSVQQHKQKQQVEKDEHLKDVASILARRIAMQLSDSESDHSNNESENDWDN